MWVSSIDRAYMGELGTKPFHIPSGMISMECKGSCGGGVCACGSDPTDPKAMWRPQGGENRTFLGSLMISTPKGTMFKKLDDPKDFLEGGNPTLPGHYQTLWENMWVNYHLETAARLTI